MGTSIKILYLIGQLRKGGAEQQLYYLLKTLNYDATVVVLSSGGYWAQYIRELGIEVIEVPRRSRFDFSRIQAIRNEVNRIQPDIIHIFLDGVTGLYERVAAWRSYRTCTVVGSRRHPASESAWVRWLKRYWLNHYVSVIITNSKESQKYLARYGGIAAHKVKYIPNGIDLERFEQVHLNQSDFAFTPTNPKFLVVGTVASLSHVKAPEIFVRAAHRVLTQNQSIRFIHIGDGPLRSEIEALSCKLGIQESLLFLGERQDVHKLLKIMDIFVLTSRLEGMPNAIMEAMASRLPCVVTNAGDSALLVSDNESGYVVPVDNEDLLAEKIIHLAKNTDLRVSMGENGYKRILAYDVFKMAQQYDDLYRDILKDCLRINA